MGVSLDVSTQAVAPFNSGSGTRKGMDISPNVALSLPFESEEEVRMQEQGVLFERTLLSRLDGKPKGPHFAPH